MGARCTVAHHNVKSFSEIYGQSTNKETERLANEASVTELTLSLNRGILSKGDPVFNCGVTLDSLNPFSRGGVYS